jgi:hypothetical protein
MYNLITSQIIRYLPNSPANMKSIKSVDRRINELELVFI